MLRFLKRKKGLTGIEVLLAGAVLGGIAYGVHKVTTAMKAEGKLEQSVENMEVYKERENVRIQRLNEDEVQKSRKEHILREKLRKIKDPKKRARAVFDSIERD